MCHEHSKSSFLIFALLSLQTAAVAAADMEKSSIAAADRKFVQKAAQGGIAEVQLGQLAAQHAQSEEVKQFGQRMAGDHSAANNKLQQLASQKGITVPTDMEASSRREYDKLQKLSGAQFDREYMSAMVSDHNKDVKEFRSEAKTAKDPDIKAFASSTLPTLEDHLKAAKAAEGTAKNESHSASK